MMGQIKPPPGFPGRSAGGPNRPPFSVPVPAFFLFLVSVSLCALGGPARADWLNHPKWEEGLAEVALYEGTLVRYGTPRPATLEAVTVREHFDPEKLVKTAPGEGKRVWPVLKTNLMRRVRTGVYEYVQMASVFQHRDDGRLVKLSCVSAEWCGNSFALFEARGGGGRLFLSSYMDDRGTNTVVVPSGHVVFYDELLPWLRQNLDSLRKGARFRIVGTLMTNDIVVREAEAEVVERKEASVSRGLARGEGTAVSLRIDDSTETFLFSGDGLRTLLRWSRGNGESFELRKSLFLDYWNRNRPGDERLLRRDRGE